MILKKISPVKTFILIPLTIFLVTFSPSKIAGDEYSDYSQKLQDNLTQQATLQKQIDDSVKQEHDLSNQINLMDNQIKLTQLKIEETDTNIAKLGVDIASLTDRLGKLQGQLENLVTISNQRIRLIHEQNFENPVAEVLLNVRGIDDFILRAQYLSHIRKNDIRVLEQLQSTKINYNDQKDLLAQKKRQQEDLKTKSLAQKASLDVQKKDKDDLLKITKNNESNYRSLIAQLKAEYEVIRQALSGKGVKIGPVKRGQVIATVGAGLVGCSTGPHVHFELDVNGVPVDPKSKLDSGEFNKTTDNYPNNVHQWFGENKNSYFYGPLGHTGIDMGSQGDLVYAARDGQASFVVDQAPCVAGGKPGRAVVVDHGDGTKTLYLHVQ